MPPPPHQHTSLGILYELVQPDFECRVSADYRALELSLRLAKGYGRLLFTMDMGLLAAALVCFGWLGKVRDPLLPPPPPRRRRPVLLRVLVGKVHGGPLEMLALRPVRALPCLSPCWLFSVCLGCFFSPELYPDPRRSLA